MKTRKTAGASSIVLLAFALEVTGFWLSAYGIARESFVELSRQTAGFEFKSSLASDSFSTESFGGAPSANDQQLVNLGLTIGLLPSERELTVEHRRDNARFAVIGILMILVGLMLKLPQLAGDIAATGRLLVGWVRSCGKNLTVLAKTLRQNLRRRQ